MSSRGPREGRSSGSRGDFRKDPTPVRHGHARERDYVPSAHLERHGAHGASQPSGMPSWQPPSGPSPDVSYHAGQYPTRGTDFGSIPYQQSQPLWNGGSKGYDFQGPPYAEQGPPDPAHASAYTHPSGAGGYPGPGHVAPRSGTWAHAGESRAHPSHVAGPAGGTYGPQGHFYPSQGAPDAYPHPNPQGDTAGQQQQLQQQPDRPPQQGRVDSHLRMDAHLRQPPQQPASARHRCDGESSTSAFGSWPARDTAGRPPGPEPRSHPNLSHPPPRAAWVTNRQQDVPPAPSLGLLEGTLASAASPSTADAAAAASTGAKAPPRRSRWRDSYDAGTAKPVAGGTSAGGSDIGQGNAAERHGHGDGSRNIGSDPVAGSWPGHNGRDFVDPQSKVSRPETDWPLPQQQQQAYGAAAPGPHDAHGPEGHGRTQNGMTPSGNPAGGGPPEGEPWVGIQYAQHAYHQGHPTSGGQQAPPPRQQLEAHRRGFHQQQQYQPPSLQLTEQLLMSPPEQMQGGMTGMTGPFGPGPYDAAAAGRRGSVGGLPDCRSADRYAQAGAPSDLHGASYPLHHGREGPPSQGVAPPGPPYGLGQPEPAYSRPYDGPSGGLLHSHPPLQPQEQQSQGYPPQGYQPPFPHEPQQMAPNYPPPGGYPPEGPSLHQSQPHGQAAGQGGQQDLRPQKRKSRWDNASGSEEQGTAPLGPDGSGPASQPPPDYSYIANHHYYQHQHQQNPHPEPHANGAYGPGQSLPPDQQQERLPYVDQHQPAQTHLESQGPGYSQMPPQQRHQSQHPPQQQQQPESSSGVPQGERRSKRSRWETDSPTVPPSVHSGPQQRAAVASDQVVPNGAAAGHLPQPGYNQHPHMSQPEQYDGTEPHLLRHQYGSAQHGAQAAAPFSKHGHQYQQPYEFPPGIAEVPGQQPQHAVLGPDRSGGPRLPWERQSEGVPGTDGRADAAAGFGSGRQGRAQHQPPQPQQQDGRADAAAGFGSGRQGRAQHQPPQPQQQGPSTTGQQPGAAWGDRPGEGQPPPPPQQQQPPPWANGPWHAGGTARMHGAWPAQQQQQQQQPPPQQQQVFVQPDQPQLSPPHQGAIQPLQQQQTFVPPPSQPSVEDRSGAQDYQRQTPPMRQPAQQHQHQPYGQQQHSAQQPYNQHSPLQQQQAQSPGYGTISHPRPQSQQESHLLIPPQGPQHLVSEQQQQFLTQTQQPATASQSQSPTLGVGSAPGQVKLHAGQQKQQAGHSVVPQTWQGYAQPSQHFNYHQQQQQQQQALQQPIAGYVQLPQQQQQQHGPSTRTEVQASPTRMPQPPPPVPQQQQLQQIRQQQQPDASQERSAGVTPEAQAHSQVQLLQPAQQERVSGVLQPDILSSALAALQQHFSQQQQQQQPLAGPPVQATPAAIGVPSTDTVPQQQQQPKHQQPARVWPGTPINNPQAQQPHAVLGGAGTGTGSAVEPNPFPGPVGANNGGSSGGAAPAGAQPLLTLGTITLPPNVDPTKLTSMDLLELLMKQKGADEGQLGGLLAALGGSGQGAGALGQGQGPTAALATIPSGGAIVAAPGTAPANAVIPSPVGGRGDVQAGRQGRAGTGDAVADAAAAAAAAAAGALGSVASSLAAGSVPQPGAGVAGGLAQGGYGYWPGYRQGAADLQQQHMHILPQQQQQQQQVVSVGPPPAAATAPNTVGYQPQQPTAGNLPSVISVVAPAPAPPSSYAYQQPAQHAYSYHYGDYGQASHAPLAAPAVATAARQAPPQPVDPRLRR